MLLNQNNQNKCNRSKHLIYNCNQIKQLQMKTKMPLKKIKLIY